MDKIIFLPTIGFGAVLILTYLLLCHRANNKAELPTIINLVFLASGLVGGSVLLVSCFSEDVLRKLSDIKIYIFIAGLAVLYVSIQGVRKELSFGGNKEIKKESIDESAKPYATNATEEKTNI